MNEKIIVSYKDGKPVSVADGVEKYNAGVVVPIVSEGDTIGSVLFILKEGETASEVEEKLAESAAGFLGKHMEGGKVCLQRKMLLQKCGHLLFIFFFYQIYVVF